MLGRLRWIIMVFIFLGAALVVRLQPDQRQTVRPGPGASPYVAVQPSPESSPAGGSATLAAQATRYGVPARSFEPPAAAVGPGDAPDDPFEASADGRFRLTAAALRRFDAHLATAGDEPMIVTRGRIVLEMLDALQNAPTQARDAAIGELDRYLAYRVAVDAVRQNPNLDTQTRATALAALHAAHLEASQRAGLPAAHADAERAP